MGILSKILYVFTKEYENDVENQIFLEKNSDRIRLQEKGTDMDRVTQILEEQGEIPKFRIKSVSEGNVETQTDSLDKTPHQKFVDELEPEQDDSDGDQELRRLAAKTQIHPLMPTKPTASKRAKLREFERKLITGSNDPNVKISAEMLKSISTNSKRYTLEEKKALREFERELLEEKDLDI